MASEWDDHDQDRIKMYKKMDQKKFNQSSCCIENITYGTSYKRYCMTCDHSGCQFCCRLSRCRSCYADMCHLCYAKHTPEICKNTLKKD